MQKTEKFIIFGMSRAVCCVPVSPLRAEPSHRTEMTSQLVFGESCEILEETKGEWYRIRVKYDGYEGWCQLTHLAEVGAAEYDEEYSALTPEWVNVLEYNGHPMKVPMGSHLTAGEERDGLNGISNHGARQRTRYSTPPLAQSDPKSARQPDR